MSVGEHDVRGGSRGAALKATKSYERAIIEVAMLYLRNYGDAAVDYADERARTLGEAGNMWGLASWMLVIEAIKVLSRTERPPDATLH